MNKHVLIIAILMSVGLLTCKQVVQKKLPILGNHYEENGVTIYPKVRNFSFINQDSAIVNNSSFSNQLYIVDFFFISCPTICPRVKKQMLRLYKRYEAEDRVSMLSHTIDVKHDTIPRLKKYANKLEAKAPKWDFVTGDKDEIYEIADDYFSVVMEDENSPGGFDHSGRLILVDKDGYVRSFCDGTDPISVNKFMLDIDLLLKEMDDAQ